MALTSLERNREALLLVQAKPLPDPCFWCAWDAGQHILPVARPRAAVLAEQATQKGSREAGKHSPSPLRLRAKAHSSCRAVPVRHWLGQPVLLSSTPGQGQFNCFTRISVPLSQPACLASLPLAHRLLTWAWPCLAT